MPLRAQEIGFYLSTREGGRGFAMGSLPDLSLGGFISTTPIGSIPLNNLFGDIPGDANADRVTDFRCIFVRNGSPSHKLLEGRVWLAELEAIADVAVALDPTPALFQSSVRPQSLFGPKGLDFSSPRGLGDGLELGTLDPFHVRAIWVRRHATDSPASVDRFVLRVEGDTVV